jgi:hypothetical protein
MSPTDQELMAIEISNPRELELRKIIWTNRNVHTGASPVWVALAQIAHALLYILKRLPR